MQLAELSLKEIQNAISAGLRNALSDVPVTVVIEAIRKDHDGPNYVQTSENHVLEIHVAVEHLDEYGEPR
jgi:hypothetical protein